MARLTKTLSPEVAKGPDQIIIVIQPVVESRIDFKKIKERYGLSPRETEVLKLVCAGFSNQEISKQLFICDYTTKNHSEEYHEKNGGLLKKQNCRPLYLTAR